MPDALPLVQPQPLQNPMDTINGLLGIRQRQQSLQTGQYTQDSAQATAQQAQQRNNELKNLSTLVINGSKAGTWVDSDGKFDADAFNKDANAVAPVYGQDSIGQFISHAKELTLNQQALQNLKDSQRNAYGANMGALATKPDLNHSDFVDEALSQIQNNKNPDYQRLVLSSLAAIPNNADTKTLQDAARRFAIAGTSADVSAAQSNPNVSMVQGPNGLVPTNTNPQAPGGIGQAGPAQQQGVAPSVQTTPQGNLGVVGNNGVRVLPSVGPQGGQQPSTPTSKLQAIPRPAPNAPASDQQRFNTQMEQGRQHAADVSAAANDVQNGVGPTRYRNDQIQDILNSKTFSPTGPGASQLNWISSKLPGESGDAFQKIGHYLAQNSAAIATKMGVPGTNAGAETAAAASGNTSQNRGALLEITKVNDAMNTALGLYNQGLAKATNNGADPSKVPAFRQAFGQNFDMNTLRYDDALRRGDKAEIDKITSSFGPAGSQQRQAGLQAMGQKRKILHSLSETGDMP